MRRYFIAALAALGLMAFGGSAAEAASIRVCAPSTASAALGPAQVKAQTSGNLYSTNARGCVLIPSSDLGDFQSMGYAPNGELLSLVVTGITAQNFTSIVLPATTYLREIIVQNTTANAVTGGIKVGTTAGGTDVVAALTCGANCLTFVADAALLKRTFSSTAAQALSIDAVTGWNSASVNVTVIYGYF